MSDALGRLVQRVVAPETVLQPRVPFFFEDADPGPPLATFERESPREALPIVERTHSVERTTASDTTTLNRDHTEHTIATHATTLRERSSSSEHHHHVTERTEPRFAHLTPQAPPPPLPPTVIAAARPRALRPPATRLLALRAKTNGAPPRTVVVHPPAGDDSEQQPHVEITIGRIDVRAVHAPETRSHASRDREPRRDLLTLEEYIRQRSRR